MPENGWTFSQDFPGATGDPRFNKAFLYQLYLQPDPGYNGCVRYRCGRISSGSLSAMNRRISCRRMFNSTFDGAGTLAGNYLPLDLRAAIDEING
ncbi:MAG: Glutathionyl-hydroquinone reductase YqjG [Sodalis sp.]|nr:MAG: Glutathionyl-hydroquinone reductase YqjG [Sodalis sp.]